MSSTRSKPLKRPTETSSYIPTWDIGFLKSARKTGPILKPIRLKGPPS
nr:MAG TPA: hypothetical protein [Caudoviricetes sp.]